VTFQNLKLLRATILPCMLGALTACSVTSVDPVVPSRELTMLCIDHNPDAGANYDSEIAALLTKMGINSRMTGGAFPGECPHRLQTRVSWSNTLIKYVVSLELVISEGTRPLGDATYSVGQAYRTPERLGSAANDRLQMTEQAKPSDKPITGGCLCENLRYRITATPEFCLYCYCKDCQASTGSDRFAGLMFAQSAFALTKGTSSFVETSAVSGRKVNRHFCPQCSSMIYGQTEMGLVSVCAGSLDDTSLFKPTMAVFTEDAPVHADVPKELIPSEQPNAQ